MKLSEMKPEQDGIVQSINGNHHFLTRSISIGIVEGSSIKIVQSDKNQPVLFYCRNSLLALARKDAEKIEVEVKH